MAVVENAAGLRYASAPGRWVLLATVLGSAVASIDATVVGIALPAIGRDFHTGLATLQWVVTAYTLTLAGLLLVAGALGDRYGRREVFLVGVVWFAVASLLCGVAPNPSVLIIARALQGVGAALLTPGNLAIAAAVVVVARRHVPESHDAQAAGRVDVAGGTLVTLGLIGLTYGLIEGPASDWTRRAVLAALTLGLLLLVAFVLWQWRGAHPMLPLELFRSAQFTATNAVTFVVYGALGGALFLLPIQLQQVSGYTALEAGISLLPITAIMLALSARSGALASRIGPRLQMSVGPVLVGLGLALLVRVDAGSYLTEVLPAVIVLALGLATTVAPLTSTVLTAVPASHAGIASAVNNDVARAGALIAVAVLPAAAGITGSAYLHPTELSAGFHTASLITAGLCVVGGALAAVTIRNPRPARVARSRRHCALDAPPAHAVTH